MVFPLDLWYLKLLCHSMHFTCCYDFSIIMVFFKKFICKIDQESCSTPNNFSSHKIYLYIWVLIIQMSKMYLWNFLFFNLTLTVCTYLLVCNQVDYHLPYVLWWISEWECAILNICTTCTRVLTFSSTVFTSKLFIILTASRDSFK